MLGPRILDNPLESSDGTTDKLRQPQVDTKIIESAKAREMSERILLVIVTKQRINQHSYLLDRRVLGCDRLNTSPIVGAPIYHETSRTSQ